MKCARFAALLVAATLVSSLVAPAGAQTQTASQFYTAYRAAFDKAKKVEDLFPYMAKQTVDQVNATPAGDQPKMFEMMKMMGTLPTSGS